MEKKQFSNPIARLLAYLVDNIIYGIPFTISYFSEAKLISIIFFIITIIIIIYNSLYFLKTKRATLGMQLLGIKLYRIKNNVIDSN